MWIGRSELGSRRVADKPENVFSGGKREGQTREKALKKKN